MNVIGAKLLQQAKSAKFVLNESGIMFFPTAQQHRDVKTTGLSYEDDYRGNAVAGLVTPDHVEIRFHNAFSDERIASLWPKVLKLLEVAGTGFGQLYYQGRQIG